MVQPETLDASVDNICLIYRAKPKIELFTIFSARVPFIQSQVDNEKLNVLIQIPLRSIKLDLSNYRNPPL